MRNLNRAFTLIELLVVVAIISILASIATVNYSQAQTRSKVSVVHNDLRVLAGALEAYRVDLNKYPPAVGVGPAFNPFSDFAEPVSARMYPLTTPIAYITHVPRDPFHATDGWGSPDLPIFDTYDYVDADAVPSRGSGLTSGAEWRLFSPGPDLFLAYGGRLAAPSDVIANARGLDYDPTNGTTSWGDIVQVGPVCMRYGDPLDPLNANRPGVVRAPNYVEQWLH